VSLGFKIVDGASDKYCKEYTKHTYKIECDFDKNLIDYGEKITIHRATISNFNQDENLVVLECVDKIINIRIYP
jgi:type I restriction enzyme M protein